MSVALQRLPWPATRFQPAYKWLLALVVVIVLTLGWRFPALGVVVPVAMTAGMGGGFFRGRWVCGNLCPRGSLLDTWLGLLPRRPLPAWLGRPALRWGVLIVLIGGMCAQLAVDPGNWQHWGVVFWRMCLVTSAVALALAVTYAPRGWCGICPVGTVAARVGGDKLPLQIASSCRACGLCEHVCPMQLAIVACRQAGELTQRDCLKCSACVKSCPSQALSWN
jgi:ferredoxin-type protein NapH